MGEGILVMSALMIYGATGYVGEHVARAAAHFSEITIIAGRNVAKLDRIARETGLERRVFGLDDPAAIDRALKDVAVVLNCAGPFKNTAEALAEACLRSRVHYLDITGEIPVYEALQARDGEAKARGVMLLPGVGFDVVPTDCLALHVKRRLPTATRLRLAFQSVGPAGLPPGTQRTAIELLQYGDRVRRNGRLTRPEAAGKTISVDFGGGPVKAQLVPWGDVFTAYYSTGIPNIEDYVAAPPSLRLQLAFGRAIAPLSKFAPIRNLMLTAVRPGPSAELRARTRTHVWAEAADEQGRRAVSRLHGPEAGLVWTTITALGAARKTLNGVASPGYQTPASAFGSDFVLEGEGVTREDVA
jgi:short subunit dehydrogenase-like uncharacterized protein